MENDVSGKSISAENCIFVGRFQPFHKGHLEAVKWILGKGRELQIVIGSAQEYSTAANPLNFFERKEIIGKALALEGIKKYKIFALPDFRNDAAWGKKLFEVTGTDPKKTAVLTLNDWTERAARAAGAEVMPHPMFFDNLSATEVRKKIAESAAWENLVPNAVYGHLKSNGMDQKIRDLQVPAETRIVKFIREKIKESGTRGAIVAVSGGIDSAVVATLAKAALGRKAQYVFLPFFKTCPFRKNVALLEKSLKIRVGKLYLDKLLREYVRVLPKGGNLVYGNLKPRIRMAILYYYANLKKLLVLGTTNKSELEIGYFTKYGDGGVDAEPIADLYKTEIFELAKILKVPGDIMAMAPTAALWPGQTDEKELGVTYFQLDTVLRMLKEGFKPDELPALTDIKEAKIQKIMARIEKNKHKLAMPPICELK